MQTNGTTSMIIIWMMTIVASSICITTRSDFPETKSFTTTGTPHLDNIKATVTMNKSPTQKVKCEFRFSTIDCEDVRAKQAKIPTSEARSLDYSQLALIKNECLTKTDGYWQYKFCIGGEITQTHGSTDNFVLGRYVSGEADHEQYEDGTLCEALKDRKRKTTVTYMCGKSAAVISIQEPQTCEYLATITHPSLCGENSAFTQYSGSVRDFQTQVAQNPLDYWILSIEQSTAGIYICTLRSVLRDMKQKMSTCFSSFSLTSSTVTAAPSGDQAESVTKHQLVSLNARQEKRQKIKFSELYEVPGGVKANKEQFNGFLEFLQTQTKEE